MTNQVPDSPGVRAPTARHQAGRGRPRAGPPAAISPAGSFPLGAALLAGERRGCCSTPRRRRRDRASARRSCGRVRNGAASSTSSPTWRSRSQPSRRRIHDADRRVGARRPRTRRRGRCAAPPPPAAIPPTSPSSRTSSRRSDGVVEHGVVTGEVRGLEVCRVVDVDGGTVSSARGGRRVARPRGVCHHPRRRARTTALAGVVAAVAAARSPDAPGHPLNRLAPERQLRWRLEQEPWLVGMESVRPAEPPVPRRPQAPIAHARRRATRRRHPVVIVCSVGVDLDVIPYAADARLAAGVGAGEGNRSAETLVVLPERDLLPVTRSWRTSSSLRVVGGAVGGLIVPQRARPRPERRR